MDRRVDTARDIDWMTVSLYLGLVTVGYLMIYAVGYDGTTDVSYFDLDTRHGSQLVWIGIALVFGAGIMLLDSNFFRTFAYIFYFLSIFFLLYVLIGGTIISGSKSWIVLGGFRFQPSEPAKFSTCLALAGYLGYNNSLSQTPVQLTALGIIGLPMALVLLQGDAGSALVFASLLFVLFREGMPLPLYIFGITMVLLSVFALVFDPAPILTILSTLVSGVLVYNSRYNNWRTFFWLSSIGIVLLWYFNLPLYALGLSAAFFLIFWLLRISKEKRRLGLIVSFIGLMVSSSYVFGVNYGFNKVLKPHQQERIKVWLKPSECDPLGALYNVTWSKLAIGSGGLTGKGYLQGEITKLDYVPEQITDFIFCTVGEEQGFVGVFVVVTLFLLLLLRIIILAERQRSRFTRVYAYGVASIFFFHLLINVGMTMGLMPVIGIPLPFISYGGSSLLAFSILLAILVRLDADRLSSFR